MHILYMDPMGTYLVSIIYLTQSYYLLIYYTVFDHVLLYP